MSLGITELINMSIYFYTISQQEHKKYINNYEIIHYNRNK